MNGGFQNQFEKAYDQDQDYIHGEAHKQLETVLVLVWLLFNIPVNDFSVMLGLNHCFLGIYHYFWEEMAEWRSS